MKRVKFTKKRNKKRKINEIKSDLSLKIKVINLISKVLFITFIIMVIFQTKSHKKKNLENEIIDKDEILYKGSKIKKEKLITDYLSRISGNEQKVAKENETLHKYLYLPEYTNDPIAQNTYKNQFFDLFSKIKKKPINKIDTIYIMKKSHFGNFIIHLNYAIFHCKIFGCHKIIFNENNTCIKNKIYIKKFDITIMPGNNINCDDDNVICQIYYIWNVFSPSIIKPQISTNYIKEEIIRNLPEVNIDPNDLYIHIRGGDIFDTYISPVYAQPPLCFYEKIIEHNKFKNIYILAMDKKNPVLDALINKHREIIFQQHDDEYDISLLVHAFNIVASTSSFVISSIKFNDNLKNYWEYDINRLSEKFITFHHHFYKLDNKFNIYTMKSSDAYADKMFEWTRSESQLKLMLEDSCPYDFVLTKPN